MAPPGGTLVASWRRLNIRTKLTIWYAAAMLVVLGTYAGTVFAVVRHDVHSTLDERLRGDFQWAHEMVEQRPDGSLAWFETDIGDASPWLQVWNDGGDLLYRSALAERLPIASSAAMASRHESGFRSVTAAAKVQFRMLAGASTIAGMPVIIHVARGEKPVYQQLQRIEVILLFGLPLGAALAAAAGYALARRALEPVGKMSARAHTITAERLNARLPVENPDDELGRLATVFNATLGRLESSFAQMSHFTADVSHELRTPLMAIRSVGEVALRDPHDAGSYRHTIASMLEEAERLGTLIDRLLALSRAQIDSRSHIHRLDARAVVDEVVTHLGILADEKQQRLTVQGAGAETPAMGDRTMLRQALINILDNAIKYTPTGGAICVSVHSTRTAVIIDVSDTGPGIDPELRTEIFDRYARGANTSHRHGLGLGLSIAKCSIEASRGTLTLEKTSNAGSTFRVTLRHAGATAAA